MVGGRGELGGHHYPAGGGGGGGGGGAGGSVGGGESGGLAKGGGGEGLGRAQVVPPVARSGWGRLGSEGRGVWSGERNHTAVDLKNKIQNWTQRIINQRHLDTLNI